MAHATREQVLSGEPLPQFPLWQSDWTQEKYAREVEMFHRKLLDYLRRLTARIARQAANAAVIDWRYDATTNKFQLKYADGGTWVDASGDQPIAMQVVRNVEYNQSSNQFLQDYTATVSVLGKGSDTNDALIIDLVDCTS